MLDSQGTSLFRGARVELHPATDTWMAGYRFGTVNAVGRKYVTVTVERLSARRTIKITPSLLTTV